MISPLKPVVEMQVFDSRNDCPVYSKVRFNKREGRWVHGLNSYAWELDIDDTSKLRIKDKRSSYV